MTVAPEVDTTIPAVRWSAWFGDRDLALACPEEWQVRLCPPHDGTDIGAQGIREAFDAPIGTSRLAELARGKHRPCIAIDDLSRPTPGDRLLEPVLDELGQAGIAPEQVTVLVAVANHRTLMRADMEQKLGSYVVEHCEVRNHFSWHGCVPLGVTERGTPVEINRALVEADLRVLVGSIVPHPMAGFSGGAKLVLPGAASHASALAFHSQPPYPGDGYGVVETALRLDAEAGAQLLGVDFIVNSVPTTKRGVAALVTGDMVAAHRQGVERARDSFATAAPAGADICIISCYPKDNETLQFSAAFTPLRTAPEPLVRPGGTVVMATAGSEGTGFHSLFGPGMPLDGAITNPVDGAELVMFSPGIRRGDLEARDRDRLPLFATWAATVEWLVRKHGKSARVSVFPAGVIQMVTTIVPW